jgi:hypothetical protein
MPSKICLNWDFLFDNKPSGNPECNHLKLFWDAHKLIFRNIFLIEAMTLPISSAKPLKNLPSKQEDCF